jgi:hypothetical protein
VALPSPEPGLVISYSYLWNSEHETGREDGTKDRPCVVIIAVRGEGGRQVVTVAPVTHAAPSVPGQAVEIPLATKQRLGLDDARSWVVVSEVNDFVWPGTDIRPLPHDASRFDYGLLPPGLFRQIRDRMAAWGSARQLKSVLRTE